MSLVFARQSLVRRVTVPLTQRKQSASAKAVGVAKCPATTSAAHARRRRLSTTAASRGPSVPASKIPFAAAEAAKAAATAPISGAQLRGYAFRAALPMVAFGFMDQSIMIHVGAALDLSLGVTLGIGTLTSAAAGQVVSDVAGVLFGGTIEALAARLGWGGVAGAAGLTAAQEAASGAVRRARWFGALCGVVAGCLLGMGSLLFHDTEGAARAKKRAQLSTLFQALMQDGGTALNADRVSLWLCEDEEEHEEEDSTTKALDPSLRQRMVWSCPAAGREPSAAQLESATFDEYDVQGKGFVTADELGKALHRIGWRLKQDELDALLAEHGTKESGDMRFLRPVLFPPQFATLLRTVVLRAQRPVPLRPGGIKHEVVSTGRSVRIDDARSDPRFNQDWDRYTGYRTVSVLAVPLLDGDKVRGVLVAKNKLKEMGDGGAAAAAAATATTWGRPTQSMGTGTGAGGPASGVEGAFLPPPSLPPASEPMRRRPTPQSAAQAREAVLAKEAGHAPPHRDGVSGGGGGGGDGGGGSGGGGDVDGNHDHLGAARACAGARAAHEAHAREQAARGTKGLHLYSHPPHPPSGAAQPRHLNHPSNGALPPSWRVPPAASEEAGGRGEEQVGPGGGGLATMPNAASMAPASGVLRRTQSGRALGAFDAGDERVLRAAAAHAVAFIRHVEGDR